MAYTVFRSDLMSGTDLSTDIVSLKFYGSDSKESAVENGTIVKLSESYIDGTREVYKAVAATSSDAIKDCAIVGSEEVMYDERKKNLSDFIHEAGSIARGYVLRDKSIFSVTAEGFTGAVPTKVGDSVGVDNGKLKVVSSGTILGTVIAIEKTSRYTYYVVKIG